MYNQIKRKESYDFVAIVIILYYSISPFLYLLRAFAGDTNITAVILRLSEPILLLTTFSFCLLKNKFKFNHYSLTFMLIGFYGLLIAIIHGNKPLDFLGGYLHYMTGIVVWMYFYNSNNQLHVDKFMRALSYYTLISYTLVIAYIYGMTFLGVPIYLGVACQVLIVVFFYNIQKRRFFLSICSLLLILISGKRGVLASLVMGSIVSLFFMLKHWPFGKRIKVLFALGLTLAVIVAAMPFANEKLVNKYIYTENKSVDDYSAGRWNEIISAYDEWTSNLETIVIGSGFGFTYTYVYSQTTIADVHDYKNVHFSYLNPPIIFGLPMSLIYFGCLFLLFIKLFRNPDPDLIFMKWASFTYFIYACFVFNLFDEPIFWMINGLLFNHHLDFKRPVVGRPSRALS